MRKLLLLLGLLLAQPALATWRVAETAHFRIYSEASEKKLREDAAVLEDYHRLLLMLTGRKWPEDAPKLDIYKLSGRGQMVMLSPRIGPNVQGFYRPTDAGIVAVSLQGSSGGQQFITGQEILLHEYAHHFMLQNASGALPAWYVEGFAEYMMTADFKPDRVDFGGANLGRAYALQLESWLPLEQVLVRPPKVNQQAFYAQSWLLTHYLFRMEGMKEPLRDYLKRVTGGEESVAAFKAAISDDLPGFQRKLRAYADGKNMTFSKMTRKAPAAAEIRVTTLPAAADDMLLPLVAMQLPQKAETDAANFARLKKAAAKLPDDPWAARALAVAEAISGDRSAAAAQLDALLLTLPDDPLLLRWRAHLYRADKSGADIQDVRAARRLLARAFKVAPNDWQVLSAYARTFMAQGGALPPAVLDVLVRAHVLAPQAPGLAIQTGMALARAGEYAGAYNAIAPLAFSPHARDASQPLRALLEALANGEKAGVDAALLAVMQAVPNDAVDEERARP